MDAASIIRRLGPPDVAHFRSLDAPAIALYEKLGTREDVMHIDIPPGRGG